MRDWIVKYWPTFTIPSLPVPRIELVWPISNSPIYEVSKGSFEDEFLLKAKEPKRNDIDETACVQVLHLIISI